jgi:hypothetical protein
MDATQNRRIWTVAIAHLLLSLFVVSELASHSAWSGPQEAYIWFEAWLSFWIKAFVLLQPICVCVLWALHFLNLGNWGGIGTFLVGLAILLTGVCWSMCFGWLFVKSTSWLNRFPILGKKVF